MSDLMPVSPIGLTPEEQAKYEAEYNRLNLIGLGNIAASGAANLANDPKLPGILGHLPFAGAIERGVGFLGTAADLAAKPLDSLTAALHIPTHVPPTPEFVHETAERPEQRTETIYNAIPGLPTVDPNNPSDALIQSLGANIGAALPVAPGGLISRAPTVVAKALHYILPVTEGTTTRIGLNAGLGAGLAGLDVNDVANAQAQQQPQPQPQPPTNIQVASASTGTMTDAAPAPTNLSDALSVPATTTSTQTQQPASLSDALNAPTPTTSTFGEEGESGTSVLRSLLEYGAVTLAVAAGVFTHRLGSAVTEAGREARLNDPTYAKAAAKYNDARLAQSTDGTLVSGASPSDQITPPMIISNPVQAVTTRVRGALLDANAPPDEYIKLNADNPTDAERQTAAYGLTHNNSSWDTRITEFMKTGRDYVTGETIPSPMTHQQDVARLSPADKDTYWTTREARDEQNDRANNASRGLDNTRHDFQQYDDAQLAAIAQKGMNDPTIAELVNRSDTIMNGMIRIGNARGFFSDAELASILNRHPNYLSEVNTDGSIAHPLGPRDSTSQTGIQRATTPAWSADAQHIEALYREFEKNEQARMAVYKQMDAQKDPRQAQFLEKIASPPGKTDPSLYTPMGGSAAREPTITVRSSGGTERYRSDNPDFVVMARGDNANKMRIAMNSAGTVRRMVSQMTTGTGAFLSGRMFPITHLPRVMMQANMNLPRNRVAGLSDLAMKKLTGGRVGQRAVVDPTFLGGAAYSNAREALDDLGFQLGKGLEKGNNNIANRFLRATLTEPRVDAISDGLKNFYYGTTTHEMRALGISGAGNVMTAEMPSYAGADGARIRLASNALVPELFMSNGALGGSRPYIIRLRQALQNTLMGVNDSGNQFIYRLNKFYDPRTTPEVLGRDVRRMSGDPGEIGSSAFARWMATTLPYANTSVQGTRSLLRAATNAPFGTSLGLVTNLGSLAALSLLTAMRSAQHIDYLQNVLTTQQRGANPTIFTNPDPSKNIQFSLSQEFMRPMYAYMLDLMSKGINIGAAIHHTGIANDAETWLKDFLSEHVENSTIDSMLHGVSDATDFASVVPIINAFAAATGNTLHLDWDKIYNDVQSHKFSFDTFTRPVGAQHDLPNTTSGDTILDGENGKRMNAIFSNIFGLFGHTLDTIAGIDRYYHQTNNFWDSLGYAGRDWLQGMRDVNPSLNTWVWENQARASVRPPVVDDVDRSLQAMAVTKGGMKPEEYTGTTGRNGLSLPDLGLAPKIPTDPTMRDLWFRTSQTYKFIDKNLMPDIKKIEIQIGAVSNQAMDAETRRDWLNKRTRDKADAYRFVKTYIDDLNAQLSGAVGKHVNVATIDWSKGPEQFHDR